MKSSSVLLTNIRRGSEIVADGVEPLLRLNTGLEQPHHFRSPWVSFPTGDKENLRWRFSEMKCLRWCLKLVDDLPAVSHWQPSHSGGINCPLHRTTRCSPELLPDEVTVMWVLVEATSLGDGWMEVVLKRKWCKTESRHRQKTSGCWRQRMSQIIGEAHGTPLVFLLVGWSSEMKYCWNVEVG